MLQQKINAGYNNLICNPYRQCMNADLNTLINPGVHSFMTVVTALGFVLNTKIKCNVSFCLLRLSCLLTIDKGCKMFKQLSTKTVVYLHSHLLFRVIK